MEAATYLIKVDNELFGYWDPTLLMIDIRRNRGEGLTIFKRVVEGLAMRYEEITLEQMRMEN
jgi:hypothetical protein